MPPDFGDPYTYPGASVLRNKSGIRERQPFNRFEYEHSASRLRELRANPLAGKFDSDHLKAVHAYIFQDVYEWAGKIRTINISKGDIAFALAPYIENEARKLSATLVSENNLPSLEKPQFVERFAHYYAEWNVLHPFREGNGRATREWLAQLARPAGYEFDQTRIDNSNQQWNQAAERSFYGDLAPVKLIFEEAIRPARVLPFDKLP